MMRYRLIDKLGEGGMGVVYRAIDRLTNEQVALKKVTVPDDALRFASRTDEAMNVREALTREFKTLASLRHPNVISVLDYGFDDGQPFYTMDLLTDATPINLAARNRSITERIDLLRQTLYALAYLHRRGIVHRDLKPENILVVNEQVKVTDFGLALTHEEASKRQPLENLAGTLGYMAPEVLKRQIFTPQSDLYSLGVIAYEIFTGEYPFQHQSVNELLVKILTTEPDLSRLINTLVTVELPTITRESIQAADTQEVTTLKAVVGRLLTKDPDDRYESASDVIRDLNTLLKEPQHESLAIRESFLQAAAFVGREPEMNILNDALSQLVAQQAGSAWLIGGEAGVGKSRLLDEVRIQALVKGIQVWTGGAVSGGGLPYQLWREPIRALAISTPLTDTDTSILQMIAPDLDRLIERPISPFSPTDDLDKQLIQTIARAFRKVKSPTLLILEDLHWAQESLEPLKQLTASLSDVPLMVIASYRDDERPALPDILPDMRHITLKRLNDQAIAQLSSSILGEAGKRQNVIELLRKETEGNVFFLVEVVRALADDAGSLADVGLRTLPDHVFTGGVYQVIQRRLSQIPPSMQPILKTAAIFGRYIDTAVLRAALPDADLDTWLNQSLNAAVLDLHEQRWRFAHEKLREAVRMTLSDEETIALHERVALAIEQVYPDNDDYAEMLLKHWQAAGNQEKERYYALRALEQMARRGRGYDVIQLGKRGLELIDKQETYTQALIYARIGRAYRYLSDYDHAIEYLGYALENAYDHQFLDLVAIIINEMGDIFRLQGKYFLAEGFYQAALDYATESNNEAQIALSLFNLGQVQRLLGNYDLAIKTALDSLEISRQINDQAAVAKTQAEIGFLAFMKGEAEDMVESNIKAAIEYYQSVGNELDASSYLSNLGMIMWSRGKFAEAVPYLQEALTTKIQLGDRWNVASIYNTLGYVYTGLDQDDAAQSAFDQALSIAWDIQAESLTLDIMAGLAQQYVKRKQYDQALDLLGLALHHPASNSDVRHAVESVLAMMKGHVSPERIKTGLERGAKRDFNAVIWGLLRHVNQSTQTA